MKLRSTLLFSFATIAFTSLGAVLLYGAETVKFPSNNPLFSIEIPDGFAKKANDDGAIRWETSDSLYNVQVIAVPSVSTKAEMRKELPKFAKKIADRMGLTNLEPGDVEDEKTTDGIQFTGLRADGKLGSGDAIVLILQGFEPSKGKWFALVTLGTEEADKAHDKDYNAIVGSITLLK